MNRGLMSTSVFMAVVLFQSISCSDRTPTRLISPLQSPSKQSIDMQHQREISSVKSECYKLYKNQSIDIQQVDKSFDDGWLHYTITDKIHGYLLINMRNYNHIEYIE